MAKIKTSFFCQNCGAQSAKWMGRCTSCGEWNTFLEEVIQKESAADTRSSVLGSRFQEFGHRRPVRIGEVEFSSGQRIDIRNTELNRVLGGGLVPGSVILIGGALYKRRRKRTADPDAGGAIGNEE
jgi:DNA repair protein RadA/Sms